MPIEMQACGIFDEFLEDLNLPPDALTLLRQFESLVVFDGENNEGPPLNLRQFSGFSKLVECCATLSLEIGVQQPTKENMFAAPLTIQGVHVGSIIFRQL
jgi:hypothetical protein